MGGAVVTTTLGLGVGVGVAKLAAPADVVTDIPAIIEAKMPVAATVKRSVLSMRFITTIY